MLTKLTGSPSNRQGRCSCDEEQAAQLRALESAYERAGEPFPEDIRVALTARTTDRHVSRCALWVEWRDLATFVYFVRSGVRGPIKIGKAADPHARLKTLQTASPAPLSMLGFIRGGEPVERSLHDYLSADRLLGEWFHPSERVVSTVTALLYADARGLLDG